MGNVVFDEQSAERIAKAVRWVEAQAVDESPDPQPLPNDEETPVTETVELSTVEPNGNLTLLSEISASGPVVTSLSGTVVTGVQCVDGNLVVTTETLANLSTSANLSDVVTSSNLTVSLSDFATVTTQNYTLPLQGE
jgi:hypothetical protein